jgi:3-methyladenine DNA glycosylase AlkD
MARFGIHGEVVLGISVVQLRRIARQHRRDHLLAIQLWRSGIHEARLLASMVDDPAQVTWEQAESWAADFDSWDVCDQACMNLFIATPPAREMALQWSGRSEEYVKRAGFAMMAAIAVRQKTLPDADFDEFLTIIAREAADRRNFVRRR